MCMRTLILEDFFGDIEREHNEGGEGDNSELGELAFKDGPGQEHGAASCVDKSSSVLCDALCNRRKVLSRE